MRATAPSAERGSTAKRENTPERENTAERARPRGRVLAQVLIPAMTGLAPRGECQPREQSARWLRPGTWGLARERGKSAAIVR